MRLTPLAGFVGTAKVLYLSFSPVAAHSHESIFFPPIFNGSLSDYIML